MCSSRITRGRSGSSSPSGSIRCPTGTPYAVGNHAGVYRVALTVDDIDVANSDLRRALPDAPAPVTVDLGETLGPMRALFFTDPDGSVVELLEQGLR